MWEVLEEDYDVPLPQENLTMAEIKSHKEKKNLEVKGRSNFVCCCFNNHFHENHISHNNKINMGLFEERIHRR